jgi:hypothetical protein
MELCCCGWYLPFISSFVCHVLIKGIFENGIRVPDQVTILLNFLSISDCEKTIIVGLPWGQ